MEPIEVILSKIPETSKALKEKGYFAINDFRFYYIPETHKSFIVSETIDADTLYSIVKQVPDYYPQ